MFSTRINWSNIFSMGEVLCFVATWVISVWATLQSIDPSDRGQQASNLAYSEPLPIVAAALD